MSIESGLTNPEAKIIEPREKKIMGITEFVNNDTEVKKIEDSIKQLNEEKSTIAEKIAKEESALFFRRELLIKLWDIENADRYH